MKRSRTPLQHTDDAPDTADAEGHTDEEITYPSATSRRRR